MESVKIKDLVFQPYISAEEIDNKVRELAAQINHDYAGKCPILVGVLNGCFRFFADLVRYIEVPCEIVFVRLSSYSGTDTTGQVKQLLGLTTDITNRDVLIVEDIVDTGITMDDLLHQLADKQPASVKVACLLTKPDKLKRDIKLDYVAFSIPNRFIVGYGLDYDELGRELNEIYVL